MYFFVLCFFISKYLSSCVRLLYMLSLYYYY